MLTFKRAVKSRPSGTWSDDDYDVFDGDQHIGRIIWTHAACKRSPRGAAVAAVIATKLTHAYSKTRIQKPTERPMVG
jgi:hypothetical protein